MRRHAVRFWIEFVGGGTRPARISGSFLLAFSPGPTLAGFFRPHRCEGPSTVLFSLWEEALHRVAPFSLPIPHAQTACGRVEPLGVFRCSLCCKAVELEDADMMVRAVVLIVGPL